MMNLSIKTPTANRITTIVVSIFCTLMILITSAKIHAQINVGTYVGIDHATAYTNPTTGGGCGSIGAINLSIGDADFVNGSAEVPLGWSFSGTWASGTTYMDGPGNEVLLVSLHTYTETWSVALRLSNGTTTAFSTYALTIVTNNATGTLTTCTGLIGSTFNYERPSQELDFASYIIPPGVGVIGIVFEPLTDGAANPDPHGVMILDNTPILSPGSSVISDSTCFGTCNGTATVVDGPDTPYSYLWDAAAGNAITQGVTNLCSGTYSVDVTGNSGTVENLTIVVGDYPQLTLTEVSSTAFICNGANGQLEVVGAGGSPGYTYANDGLTFNVSPVFSGIPGGLHTITVQDINSCQETIDITIAEGAPIGVSESVTDEICLGDCQGMITLIATGDLPMSYSIDNCVTTQPTGSFLNLCPANFNICVSDANGCQYTNLLTVNASTNIGIDGTMNTIDPLCIEDNAITITAVNVGSLSGIGVIGGTFDPTLAGVGTHTITNTNVGTCISTSTLDVIVNPMPIVEFLADVTDGCEDLTVNFANTGDLGVVCFWDFGNNNSSTDCFAVANTYENDGTYDVSLTVVDLNGCATTVTYPNYIIVRPLPVANFINDPVTASSLKPEFNFTNTSSGDVAWLWTFDAFGNSSLEDPSFTFTDGPGGYLVTLIVESEFGCYDTIIRPVTVSTEELIFIPNAFTPDGDEFNQNFRPIFTEGYDLFDFNMKIFNRWGQIIFESNDDTIGWDGTFGGKMVQPGVYTWFIEYKTIETDERKTRVGHLNVIR